MKIGVIKSKFSVKKAFNSRRQLLAILLLIYLWLPTLDPFMGSSCGLVRMELYNVVGKAFGRPLENS
jgi:hypothetical protein